MAKDDGSIESTGLSIAATIGQIGGGASFLYGISPLSGDSGSMFMGIGALGAVAGLAIGIGNMKR